jgi:hypothetical protein
MKTDQLIEKSLEALENRNSFELRRISAHTLSEAAIEEHRELMLLALVDYALSKILSKLHYEDVDSGFYGKVKKHFERAVASRKEEKIKHLEAIEDLVIKLDEKEGNFSENLMTKARIKKASKLYDQGFSLRRAAELTGANPSEVLNYVGGSKIHEFHGSGKNARRLQKAREVFIE